MRVDSIDADACQIADWYVEAFERIRQNGHVINNNMSAVGFGHGVRHGRSYIDECIESVQCATLGHRLSLDRLVFHISTRVELIAVAMQAILFKYEIQSLVYSQTLI